MEWDRQNRCWAGRADPEIISILSQDELAVVDFIAGEYGHVAPEQLGYLTKRLNTEIPPETWGTNASAAVNEEAFLRLNPEWQNLCERISEQDLTDRARSPPGTKKSGSRKGPL